MRGWRLGSDPMTDMIAGPTVAAADPELERVRAAQHGDSVAFDMLVIPRLERLLRLAASILADESEAQDAVQEACLHAWRQLPRLRDPDRFEAWLWQIAINECRTRLRGRKRSAVHAIAVEDLTGGEEPSLRGQPLADEVVAIDAIRRAFARLDPDKRAILVLHHVEQRSVVQIATHLGIPDGTVKWRLHAARRALERALEAEEGA